MINYGIPIEKAYLPNFIIIGANKSGTTSLSRYLEQHPDVFFSYPKEPHFFTKEKPLGEWVRSLDEYSELFKESENYKVVGEASTGYLYYANETSPNIYSYIPDCKIIIMLRNPLERIYSNYWHNVRDNREDLSFEEALEYEEKRISNNWEWSYFYKNNCFVSDSIKQYQKVFGEDNVKILFFDDMKNDFENFMRDVYDFLGLEYFFDLKNDTYNKSGPAKSKWFSKFMNKKSVLKAPAYLLPKKQRDRLYWYLKTKNTTKYPPMNEDTKEMLKDYLKDEVKELENITGRDLSYWLK